MAATRIAIIALCLILAQSIECSPHVHSVVVRASSSNLVTDVINTAIAAVTGLGDRITAVIKEGSDMLQKFRDNSTDYSTAFKIDVIKELDNAIAGFNKAVAEAQSSAAAANTSVAACFTAKRKEVQDLALAGGNEVVQCVVTKVTQITDLAAKLVDLSNNTVMLIPNTITKLTNCTNSGDFLVKLKCVSVTVGDAIFQLTNISMSVALTVSSASLAYGSLTTDLSACAMSTLVGLQQRLGNLTLTIGSCAQKSIG